MQRPAGRCYLYMRLSIMLHPRLKELYFNADWLHDTNRKPGLILFLRLDFSYRMMYNKITIIFKPDKENRHD